MALLYSFQFYVYSACILLFTVYSYVVYYSDLISLYFRADLLQEYDYVIVGSGTAGSLIAHRLSKETNFSFVVFEAGSNGQSLMDIPIVGPALHGSLFDWKFQTTPQEYACHAFMDNKCRLPQGKITGGSSKLNNMVHFRGNLSHYTKWFNGKYDEAYIRQQFETIEKDYLFINDIMYETELANAILEAAAELGYNQIGLESLKGFARSKLSQNNGKRWSMSDNLKSEHVITNTLVEKVLIKDNTAYAVQIHHLGKTKTIKARKSIIVSAGTFNSPKLLQLSGIGPVDVLKKLKIPLFRDLPVGKNLQDHIATGLDLILFDKPLSISGADILKPVNSFNYFVHGKGPLTTPGCEVVGFLSTSNSSTPDLQFMVLPTGISTDRGSSLRKSLGVKDEVWNSYFTKTFDKHTATILPIVLHPKSKGEVFITSKDVNIPASIDPKYLSHEDDKNVLLKGLKLVFKFVETNAMKQLGAYVNPIPFPGCDNLTMFTDEYWFCYIKQLTLPSYHPVGTCSMGSSKTKSVVDTTFKVYGVNNLYVVDASVLPTLPSGNINAAIAMMANVFVNENIIRDTNNLVKIKNLNCNKYELMYDVVFRKCLRYKLS